MTEPNLTSYRLRTKIADFIGNPWTTITPEALREAIDKCGGKVPIFRDANYLEPLGKTTAMHVEGDELVVDLDYVNSRLHESPGPFSIGGCVGASAIESGPNQQQQITEGEIFGVSLHVAYGAQRRD